MMTRVTVLFAGLSFLLLGQGAPLEAQGAGEVATANRLAISEIWSFRQAEGLGGFTAVAAMTELADGRLWVVDGASAAIVELSGAGEYLRIAAGQGGKPGELNSPDQVDRGPHDSIYVLEGLRGTVEVFSPKGEFARRLSLEGVTTLEFPKGLEVLPTGDFVLSAGIETLEGSIHRFSPDGGHVRSWLSLPEADIGNPRLDRKASLNAAGGPMNVTADGDVLFSRAAPHGIHRFSALGEERATVAADEELLEPGVETFLEVLDWERFRVRNDYWYPRSVFVAELEDGRILNVVWFTRDGYSLWQLYGPDGRLLDSRRTEPAYHPHTFTRNGDLLAHYLHPATLEPIVVRLRVEY